MLPYPLKSHGASSESPFPTLTPPPRFDFPTKTYSTPVPMQWCVTGEKHAVALAHSPYSPQRLSTSRWLVPEGKLPVFPGDYFILFLSKLQYSSPPFLSANGFTCDVPEKPSGRGRHVPTTVSSNHLHTCPDRLSSFLLLLLKCPNFEIEPLPPTPQAISHGACLRALPLLASFLLE